MKSPAMKSPIWTIFRKEVLENLRDRKTVMNALIVGPLLGPVLFAVLPFGHRSQDDAGDITLGTVSSAPKFTMSQAPTEPT